MQEDTVLKRFLQRAPELGIALLLLVILASLILPLPAFLLDILLALSISVSVLVLLTTIYTSDPIDFNVFPGILLILTLFRLGLNITSTKLILVQGNAGRIIEAFGNFVVGGNLAIGILVFLILVLVNFIVITKGAGRVAEVAARFTLDAMVPKQMSIDSDLQAGLIDEEEAKERRSKLNKQADFYGSMDGAAKFVRGDAIAGLIITAITLVGGLYVGVVQNGMPLGEAANTYSKLTIGDGLVSQIPALIISTAAGLIITQASGSTHMGHAIFSQLTQHTRALQVSAGVILLFALIPGLPFVPFIILASAIGLLAYAASQKEKREALNEFAVGGSTPEEPLEAALPVIDALEIQIGFSLYEMVDEKQGGDLIERIRAIRQMIAMDLGVLIPPVRVHDNPALAPNTYSILIRGVEAASGEIFPKAYLAVDNGLVSEKIQGFRETRDPSFGLPSVWINEEQRVDAEVAGYDVVKPASILATHLQETIRGNAAELLGRQEVQQIADTLGRSHPAVVKGVVPERVSLGTLHRVLQRLLRENVPVLDMVTILESLADASDRQPAMDTDTIVEHVRRSLKRVITAQYLSDDGSIPVILLGKKLESALMRNFGGAHDLQAHEILSAKRLSELTTGLGDIVMAHRTDGRYPPLIAPPALRGEVQRLLSVALPGVPVLSAAELVTHVPIHDLAVWDLDRGVASGEEAPLP